MPFHILLANIHGRSVFVYCALTNWIFILCSKYKMGLFCWRRVAKIMRILRRVSFDSFNCRHNLWHILEKNLRTFHHSVAWKQSRTHCSQHFIFLFVENLLPSLNNTIALNFGDFRIEFLCPILLSRWALCSCFCVCWFNHKSGSNSPQLATWFYKGCRLLIPRSLLRGSSFFPLIKSSF